MYGRHKSTTQEDAKLVDEAKVPVPLAFRLTVEVPRWLVRKGYDPEVLSQFTMISIAGNVISNKLQSKHLRPLMKELCMSPQENQSSIVTKWVEQNNKGSGQRIER